MCPVHSAIASARLVAKLPSEASACVEGEARYVWYQSFVADVMLGERLNLWNIFCTNKFFPCLVQQANNDFTVYDRIHEFIKKRT